VEVIVSRYDSTTALIVVDVQNDFADPDGSLSVAGGAEAIPFINDEIATASEAGSLVVYTQDWHPESTPHFAKDGGIWPVHCVGGTWGAELHPNLYVAADAPRIRKGTAGEDGYSGFTVRDPESGEESPTGLAALLAERGIERAVVVGLATDYCVKATAVDAAQEGLETTLLADGVRAVNLSPGDGARAVAEMVAAGVTVE
jgi:nicotinamidase/pyrazinamidase